MEVSLKELFELIPTTVNYLIPAITNMNLLIPILVGVMVLYDLFRPFLPKEIQKNEKITIIKITTIIIAILSAFAIFALLIWIYVLSNLLFAFTINTPSLVDTILILGMAILTGLIYLKYREDSKWNIVSFFSKILALYFVLFGIPTIITLVINSDENLIFRAIRGLGLSLGIIFFSAVLYSKKVKPLVNMPEEIGNLDEIVEKFIEKHQGKLKWILLAAAIFIFLGDFLRSINWI